MMLGWNGYRQELLTWIGEADARNLPRIQGLVWRRCSDQSSRRQDSRADRARRGGDGPLRRLHRGSR